MEQIQQFARISETLYNDELKRWKQAGKKIMGIQCSNLPEEIIHAAGIIPLRIRASHLGDTSTADAHLARINCSYSRAMLELALSGGMDFLDGFIATNTCDHHLRLGAEISKYAGFPSHYFEMSHAVNQGSRDWFQSESQKLIGFIQNKYGITIGDADLRQSIAVYNTSRMRMGQINQLRKRERPALSGSEYMNIVIAGMSMPRELFNQWLEALLPALDSRQIESAGKYRVLVMGASVDSPELIEFMESKGALVVADNLCFGSRHFDTPIEVRSDDPLGAIVERYFSRIPCPSAIGSFDQVYAGLKRTIGEYAISGIINVRLKFCDHWAGQYKMLRDALAADNGVPILDLEREYSADGSGQMSTRLQAFFEILKG